MFEILASIMALIVLAVVLYGTFITLPSGNFDGWFSQCVFRFTQPLRSGDSIKVAAYWIVPILLFLLFSGVVGLFLLIAAGAGVRANRIIRSVMINPPPTGIPVG